jgi:DNA-binding PadR family transcriptional regulator
MTRHSSGLTELEGAVLSEIHHRLNRTAFKVRRAFQTSPSIEWSGSAGAVYPAIRRLVEAGLIESTPITTGKKGSHLSLTHDGVAALEDWICDPVRATSVGVDPFRLRAGLWATLDSARRADALLGLKQAVGEELARLTTTLDDLDPVERARSRWSIQLQTMRLQWLEDQTAQSDAAPDSK